MFGLCLLFVVCFRLLFGVLEEKEDEEDEGGGEERALGQRKQGPNLEGVGKKGNGWCIQFLGVYANCPKYRSLYTQHNRGAAHPRGVFWIVCIYTKKWYSSTYQPFFLVGPNPVVVYIYGVPIWTPIVQTIFGCPVSHEKKSSVPGFILSYIMGNGDA